MDNNPDELIIKVSADVSDAERKIKQLGKTIKTAFGAIEASSNLTEALKAASTVDAGALKDSLRSELSKAKTIVKQGIDDLEKEIHITSLMGEPVSDIQGSSGELKETFASISESAENVAEKVVWFVDTLGFASKSLQDFTKYGLGEFVKTYKEANSVLMIGTSKDSYPTFDYFFNDVTVKAMSDVAKGLVDVAQKFELLNIAVNSSKSNYSAITSGVSQFALAIRDTNTAIQTFGKEIIDIDDYVIKDIDGAEKSFRGLKSVFFDFLKVSKDSSKAMKDIDVPKEATSRLQSFKQYLNDATLLFKPIKDNSETSFGYIGRRFRETAEDARAFANAVGSVSKSAISKLSVIGKGAQALGKGFVALGGKAKGVSNALKEVSAKKGNGLWSYTKEYADLGNKIKDTEDKIKSFQAKMDWDKMINPGVKDENRSAPYQRWQKAVIALEQELERLKASQNRIKDSGKYLTLNNGELNRSLMSIGSTIGGVLGNALKSGSALFRRLAKSAISVLNPITKIKAGINSLQGMIGRFTTSIGRLGKMLRLMLVRSALRSAIDGAKQGFNNLVQYSATTNRSVSELYSSILQLRNALAAMLAPIWNASANFQGLASILNTLVQKLIGAANAVNQVLSALVGNGKWIKAKNNFVDYAKSLDKSSKSAKKLNQQLQSIDELNVLTTDKDDDTDTALSPGDMFEMADVEQRWKDFAEWLKSMWENGDFTELGQKIGIWIKNGLDSIPWEKVKATAYKVGKSLATLINGLVKVKGLGTSVGKTLAETLNTIFSALAGFVDNIDGLAIGKFLADLGNALLENIDWELIRHVFVTGAKKLSDAINGLISGFRFENLTKTISNALNTLAETVYTFFKETHFAELGRKLGEAFGGLFKSVEDGGIDFEMIGRAIGSAIQKAIDFVVNFIDGLSFEDIKNAIQNFFKGMAEELDFGEVAFIIKGLLALALAKAFTVKAFDLVGTAFREAMIENIKKKMLGESVTPLLAPIGAKVVFGIGASIFTAYAGFNIGKMLGEKFAESFGDEAGVEAYENFSWFKEGGFFPTLLEEAEYAVDGLKEHFGGLKDTVDEKIGGIIDYLNGIDFSDTSLFGLSGEVVNSLRDIVVEFAESGQEYLGGLITFVSGQFSGDWSKAWDGVKLAFKGAWDYMATVFKTPINLIIGGINMLIGSIEMGLNNIIDGINKFVAGINKASAGLSKLTNMPQVSIGTIGKVSLPRIATFEQGGFPEDGWFRASKGEMIGKFDNGQSVVANNQQIVDGIANGVANANAEQNALFEEMIDYLAVIASKQFGISENDIFDAVQRKAQSYTNRTGNSAFA